MNIFVNKGGVQYGPYSLVELQGYLDAGNFTLEDLACYDSQNWVAIAQVPGIVQPLVGAVQQPVPTVQIKPVEEEKNKSGLVGGLVALFLVIIGFGIAIFFKLEADLDDQVNVTENNKVELERKQKLEEERAQQEWERKVELLEKRMEEEEKLKEERIEQERKLEEAKRRLAENNKIQLQLQEEKKKAQSLKLEVQQYFVKKTKLFHQNYKNRIAWQLMWFENSNINYVPNGADKHFRTLRELPDEVLLLYNKWLNVIAEKDADLQKSLFTDFELKIQNFQHSKREFHPNLKNTFVRASGEDIASNILHADDFFITIDKKNLENVDRETIYFLRGCFNLLPPSSLYRFDLSYSKLQDSHKFFKEFNSELYNLCDEIFEYHVKGIIPKEVVPED